MVKLQHTPLGDQVYTIIWDQIASHKLRPGDKISDLRLSQELGVSRTPVREAPQVPVALIPPPQAELAALGALIAIGDILALQERAAQLEQRDPQWRAFARELARLAGQFELEQLRALLNEYLPTDTSSG
jgi:DNA-binding transcriptional MocR family regulator